LIGIACTSCHVFPFLLCCLPALLLFIDLALYLLHEQAASIRLLDLSGLSLHISVLQTIPCCCSSSTQGPVCRVTPLSVQCMTALLTRIASNQFQTSRDKSREEIMAKARKSSASESSSAPKRQPSARIKAIVSSLPLTQPHTHTKQPH
jgi:hypothetical protein